MFDDASNLDNEYSYSNIDERHQFAANGMVYAPAGFEISMTTRMNSGRPFSAQVGTDLNRDGVLRDRPVIDGAVVRRNTFRNEGYADLSLRVQHSVNMIDMVIWGLIAMFVQIAAFVAVKMMIPAITQDIPADKGAQGFFLGCASLGVGLLNAACMSY